MRVIHDLSGYWQGTLTLEPELDVKAPPVIERDFYLPQSWNVQVEDLLWPGSPWRELSGIVRPLQNQNFRDQQRKYNEGVITYSRTVVLPSAPGAGHRAFLVFEGSNYRTEASVNGVAVGSHDGGHLPFAFDITGAIQPGDNRFEITVDNLRRKSACPQEQFNWRNYGGVYRPLSVEWRPSPAIRQVRVRPCRRGAGWTAMVEVLLDGDCRAEVAVEIASGTCVERAVARVSDAASCRLGIPVADPVVWQPGTGGMSQARVRLIRDGQTMDEQAIAFGFREIAFKEGRVHINGQPIRLLGAAMHEQHPAMGSSLSPWQAHLDIKLLKNAGLNAVRTAHYPHARGLYEACDREGILVIADLPCWQFNAYHFDDTFCRDQAVGFAREMAAYLNPHPSVIGWNIETESAIHLASAHAFFEAIADAFRAADPDRLLVSASQTDPPEHLAIIKKAKSAQDAVPPQVMDLVDIAGINDYSGWYGEKASFMADHLDHVHSQAPGRTFLVTEFGAESTPGHRSLTMEHYSEDYQAELIAYHMENILARNYIAGFFLWLFIDYECASIGISGINSKGLLDPYRRPKLAFNRVQQILRTP